MEILFEPLSSDNYYATVENFSADTKTELGNSRSVVWSRGDQIAIFEGTSKGKAYKVVDAAVGTSAGEFSSVKNQYTDANAEISNNTIAVYPFSKDLTVSRFQNDFFFVDAYNITGITFPSQQKYTSGSFSDEAFPMTAIETKGSRSLSFRNIGGVIKLSLTGNCAVSKITVNGHSNESLSGPATVSLGQDRIPRVSMTSEASKSVTLVCDTPVKLDSETPTDFFICIPPTDFKAGFTVTIVNSDGGSIIRETKARNNVPRSSILAMPTLNYDKEENSHDYESPYGYAVSKFLRGLGKEVKHPDDLEAIKAWLASQDFVKSVESVECDPFYNIIRITFTDGKAFDVVNNRTRPLQIRPLQVVDLRFTYHVESIPDEVIQDNTNFLFIEGSDSDLLFNRTKVEKIVTPLSINIECVQGLNFIDYSTLSNYGAILIGSTYGIGNGGFLLSNNYYSGIGADAATWLANGYLRQEGRNGYPLVKKDVYLDELYSQALHHPFMFANYCWSAEFPSTTNINGSFVGYKNASSELSNPERAKAYFSSVFNGGRHCQDGVSNEEYEVEYGTEIKSYGELNQRYFSITTEDPESSEVESAIIRGEIKGYKNLKKGIQYKVYYKEGTDFFQSLDGIASIPLEVAADGTINQDITAHLVRGKDYTYRIGFEYDGNYYIGDSKTIYLSDAQFFESNYGYLVKKYVKSLGTDIKFPEDVQIIIDWLEEQEFVESVEFDDHYIDIHATFSDGTDFHVVTIYDSESEEINTKSVVEESESGSIIDVSEVKNEFIQENNKLLYIWGDTDWKLDYKDFFNVELKHIKKFSEDSPLRVNITEKKGLEVSKENFNNYGAIIISGTHGVITGDPIIETSGRYNVLVRRTEFLLEKQTFPLKSVYKNFKGNNPFVYANYCWSSYGAFDTVNEGSFVGYDAFSDVDNNHERLKIYIIHLFNGYTHNEAFRLLKPYQFKPYGVGEYGFGPTITVTPKSYGEPNLRYFSIATEDPESSEVEKAIIKGEIKGYKNLKSGIKYKVYYREGSDVFESPEGIASIPLEVAADGTINQNITAHLERNKEYTFRIGFEYNGNYYIGESKTIFLIKPEPEWVDLGGNILWATWNVDAYSPEEYGGYYAWGETETKSEYTRKNHKHYLSAWEGCRFIGNEISGTGYDAARVKWGDGARMPTSVEAYRLSISCTFKEGTYNGVKGVYVIGSNGNSIFLPYAGEWFDDRLIAAGSYGGYWTGTYAQGIYGGETVWAHVLNCGDLGGRSYFNDRTSGRPIRPVKDKQKN